MMNTLTSVRDRTSLAMITAHTPITALTDEPELGSARCHQPRFSGVAMVVATPLAVGAFIPRQEGGVTH